MPDMPNVKMSPTIEELGDGEKVSLIRAIFAELRDLDELRPLAIRLAKSRAKYPSGATIMSLLDEAGEVAHAVNKYEPADRVRDELLDVACVAMRLYAGEVDDGIAMDGLVQVRKDGEKRHG